MLPAWIALHGLDDLQNADAIRPRLERVAAGPANCGADEAGADEIRHYLPGKAERDVCAPRDLGAAQARARIPGKH